MTKLIDIYDANGNRLYMNLIDDGSGIYRFASGWGFVTDYQIASNKWSIKHDCESRIDARALKNVA
jgi:hypothetical protein